MKLLLKNHLLFQIFLHFFKLKLKLLFEFALLLNYYFLVVNLNIYDLLFYYLLKLLIMKEMINFGIFNN